MKFNKLRSFAIIAAALLMLSCQKTSQTTEKNEPMVVFPDGFTVNVDLAVSEKDRALGLMFVPSLPDDKGMFFISGDYSQSPFWMKNCLISLDLVWLDKDGAIVDISHNVPPCHADPCPNYFPAAPYFYVLEVRGGLANIHGLNTGDKLVVLGI